MLRYAPATALAIFSALLVGNVQSVAAQQGENSGIVLVSDGALVEIIDDRPLTADEAAAREPQPLQHSGSGSAYSMGSDCGSACGSCDSGCRRRCKFLCLLRGRNSESMWSNCECNGSYKYPVPPLFTYHWPGLYSHQLMTDYHSPWRFLPIRAYEDEDPIDFDGSAMRPSAATALRPVSHAEGQNSAVEYRDVEPVSVKMRRRYGG